MKTFEFKVTMKVADCWIEDGSAANMPKIALKLDLKNGLENLRAKN